MTGVLDGLRRVARAAGRRTLPARAGGGPRIRTRVRSERGAELIEFALLSVVFLTTIFMILEGGRLIWNYNIVANLAKEGARWASVRGSSSTTPATASDVQTYLQGRSQGMSVTVTTTWLPDNQPGSTVQVRVQGSFTPVVGLVPSATINLRSISQMLVAR